jgi:hypothetical protein
MKGGGMSNMQGFSLKTKKHSKGKISMVDSDNVRHMKQQAHKHMGGTEHRPNIHGHK